MFTSDGPEDHTLSGGSIPGVLATVNFRLRPGALLSAGPQRSLYVPGPVLREGTNDVWLLEFEQVARTRRALRPVAADPTSENPPASP
ncbi:hypothetical protein ACFYO2_01495 [Streptomyces sp. NPDC006602]|uniref:hypothetical protein n=1 Tax=Streptomyces sp. NPDC006602 TaxID=3364751 RepID=UPI00369494ED